MDFVMPRTSWMCGALTPCGNTCRSSKQVWSQGCGAVWCAALQGQTQGHVSVLLGFLIGNKQDGCCPAHCLL